MRDFNEMQKQFFSLFFGGGGLMSVGLNLDGHIIKDCQFYAMFAIF